jgi:hypothetical protein
MNRRAVIRNLLLGALVTGLGPLTGAGADPAAAGESPEALCSSTFGESGPVGGPISGVGPSGDPLKTTIGWDPYDWSDGIREIVTCVSVGGRAAPALTTSIPAPRNDGSLVVSLTLPPGEPGTLVCEQSILVGPGNAADPHRTTSPVCFKLRSGEAPPAPGVPAAGAAAPTPPAATPPARAVPAAPSPKPSVVRAPAPQPASTPPARAAAEATRGRTGMPAAVVDPVTGMALPAPARPYQGSRAPAAQARPSNAAAPAPAPAAAATSADPAAAPVTALARTGIDDHIPLASAGGFLAIGGAAIIFGAPGGRRRRPARRPI